MSGAQVFGGKKSEEMCGQVVFTAFSANKNYFLQNELSDIPRIMENFEKGTFKNE